MITETRPLISVTGLTTQFGSQVVHQDLKMEIPEGSIFGVVGGSGSGKTVLMRTLLGLNHPAHGQVSIDGLNPFLPEDQKKLQTRVGVMFQGGALFSSLTIGENLIYPLMEIAHLPQDLAKMIAALRLKMVGLEVDTLQKYPSQLSGGMVKRAALARALALDPKILFLDEPTSGLDPNRSQTFDELIKTLRKNLGLTVMMITHDQESLNFLCDHVGAIVDKKIVSGPLERVMAHPHPWIQDFFWGERGKRVFASQKGGR